MRIARLATVALLVIPFASCRQGVDTESLRQEILDLHRSFIRAHLEKDAEFIAEPTAPEYVFVANGLVEKMNADEMEEMLSGYLDATEFSHYTDVADPIIGFSDDRSLAWAIVQVRVAGSQSGPDGASSGFDTRWAWITLYRRAGDGWLRITDVSTNRPFESDD